MVSGVPEAGQTAKVHLPAQMQKGVSDSRSPIRRPSVYRKLILESAAKQVYPRFRPPPARTLDLPQNSLAGPAASDGEAGNIGRSMHLMTLRR